MQGDTHMINEAAFKIEYARRRTNPEHPEYSQAWANRLEQFQAWHQRLLGNE